MRTLVPRALLLLHACSTSALQLGVPTNPGRPTVQRAACMVATAPAAGSRGNSGSQQAGADGSATDPEAQSAVYFVMGGPGSGKGTQCAKLVELFGFVHLSAGDLLRAEVRSGSPQGLEIAKIIEEGKIVSSEITVGLLKDAMSQHSGPFLVDGFPRSLSNLHAFEAVFEPCRLMLFLQLSEHEMEKRLLKRGLSSGRSDDNSVTIRKRFHTFTHDSMPVVENMQTRGLLRTIDADASEEEVFARVCQELGLST